MLAPGPVLTPWIKHALSDLVVATISFLSKGKQSKKHPVIAKEI